MGRLNGRYDLATARFPATAPGRRAASPTRFPIVAMTMVMAASGAIALMSQTPFVVLASGAVLDLIIALFWQEREPPILLFPMVLQWASVAVKPYMSGFEQVPLNSLAEYGGDLERGAYFSLAALSVIAVGIRYGLGKSTRDGNESLQNEACAWPPRKILRLSIAMLAIGPAMIFLAAVVHPLRQLFLSFANIEYAGLFCFSYWCIKLNKGYIYLIIIMAYEIIIGFTGFFADFKTPMIVLAMAALSARRQQKIIDVAIIVGIIILTISLAAFWSEIKTDYRKYVNEGTQKQVIKVPISQRINYIKNEATEFDLSKFEDGLILFINRESYIDFLSNTMEFVPAVLPHENGKRVGTTLMNIALPRAFFPNKPSTEFDSDVTAKYSGVPITVQEGTSISIGYLGELYIDFGIFGALAACGIGGLMFGWVYRALRDQRGPILLRYGLCAVAALSISTFETALVKVVGGTVTVFIGAFILQRYALPPLMTLLRLRTKPGAYPKFAVESPT